MHALSLCVIRNWCMNFLNLSTFALTSSEDLPYRSSYEAAVKRFTGLSVGCTDFTTLSKSDPADSCGSLETIRLSVFSISHGIRWLLVARYEVYSFSGMRTVLAHQYSIAIEQAVVVDFLAPTVVEPRRLLLLISSVPAEAEKVREITGALGCPEAFFAGDRFGKEGRGHHMATQWLI